MIYGDKSVHCNPRKPYPKQVYKQQIKTFSFHPSVVKTLNSWQRSIIEFRTWVALSAIALLLLKHIKSQSTKYKYVNNISSTATKGKLNSVTTIKYRWARICSHVKLKGKGRGVIALALDVLHHLTLRVTHIFRTVPLPYLDRLLSHVQNFLPICTLYSISTFHVVSHQVT